MRRNWRFSWLLALISPLLSWAADASALFAATLSDLDDRPTSLALWKGRPLLVNFWARWCGPCKTEIPELNALYARHRDDGLEILGIAVEDRAAAVKDFARAYEIAYPLLIAKEHGLPLMKALGNTKLGLPFTLAIDREGRIVSVKLGAATSSELSAAATAALGR